MDPTAAMPVFTTLDAVTDLVAGRRSLYVRWSRGPSVDLQRASSMDDLTGVRMPGLSASPLDVEGWWGDRPTRVWVARRLYDYSHLPRVKDSRTRPWVLRGQEMGRGPDNEPLVRAVRPLGWIHHRVIAEADAVITRQPGRWGPIRRDGSAL
ncbi:DUF6098 family protein [Streptomyces smyrnaeus]|uniref:DUF6098 family protein n=1 Tax=Streptomyces TaxID=1883 RepID=UPI000C1822D4|nr:MULTISPECIES: DUF6098 family protein [unclassified Streptomyces]MBQ0863542.1 hypothetical protein [Streptomyces sp. RK75]MBQ1122122.1 hypothetical protein [Streptomyces sp. B15]MBQ1161825.1 hypothetical protein [Streptomyces sp. A73]